MRRSTAAAMFALTMALAAVTAASAQGRTRTIKGTVVDSAKHKPVSQAAIFIGRTFTGQRTGDDGTFHVSSPQGPLVVMIRRPGYVPVLTAVAGDTSGTETDMGTASMQQVKSDADRAAVQDADMKIYPELARFYDHKARFRQGLYLSPDDLQRGGSLFTLIRQKPNFHFICIVTQRGDLDCGQEASRGRTSITNPNPTSSEQTPCVMQLWSNGIGPQKTLDQIQQDEVLAVEAFPHPGVTPPEFMGSPCAAIMLWMKEGGPVLSR
jgi:carboxypeptidase-like protein